MGTKKNYKRGDNHTPITKQNNLDNYKKYYDSHRDYHLSRNRKYYLERMFEWYEWFNDNGYSECEICGFNDHPKAIDFHHINPETKVVGIGKFINGRQCNIENQKIIKEELEKCQCLCANCHRIKHFVMTNEHTDKG